MALHASNSTHLLDTSSVIDGERDTDNGDAI